MDQPSWHYASPPDDQGRQQIAPHSGGAHGHQHRDIVPAPHGQRIYVEGALEGAEGGLSLREQIELQGQGFVDEKELQFRQTIIDLQSE